LSLVGLVHIPNAHACIGTVVRTTTTSSRHMRSCVSNSTYTAATIAKAVEKAVEKSCCRPPLHQPSTWSTRRYTLPAEALQLYSPLQPSTALQLYTLYSIQSSTAPLSLPISAAFHPCDPLPSMESRTYIQSTAGPPHMEMKRLRRGVFPYFGRGTPCPEDTSSHLAHLSVLRCVRTTVVGSRLSRSKQDTITVLTAVDP
jgi:hypothetical protein